MKLVSENISGNTHDVVNWLNRAGLAAFTLQIHTTAGGGNSIAVLRVPDYFTLERWIYDHATPERQRQLVEVEIRQRMFRGDRL